MKGPIKPLTKLDDLNLRPPSLFSPYSHFTTFGADFSKLDRFPLQASATAQEAYFFYSFYSSVFPEPPNQFLNIFSCQLGHYQTREYSYVYQYRYFKNHTCTPNAWLALSLLAAWRRQSHNLALFYGCIISLP